MSSVSHKPTASISAATGAALLLLSLAVGLPTAADPDPLHLAYQAGQELINTRGGLMDLNEAVFATPRLTLAVYDDARDGPQHDTDGSCLATGATSQSRAATAMSDKTYRFVIQNPSDQPWVPVLLETTTDGQLASVFPMRDHVMAGDRMSLCLDYTPTPGGSLVRVVGLPSPDSARGLGDSLALLTAAKGSRAWSEADQARLQALAVLLESDGRQRFAQEAFRAAGGELRAPDTVLLGSARSLGSAGFSELVHPRDGILVYATTADTVSVGLYTQHGPPVVETLTITPEELPKLVDTLVLSLVGGIPLAQAPRRGLAAAVSPVPMELDGPAPKAVADALLPASFRAALADVTSLIVVPTGPLGRLPWAALELDGQPLVATHTLAVAPDLATATQQPKPWVAPTSNAMVVGDPKLDTADYPDWVLPPLPGAREEARTVAQSLGVEPLLGLAATRSAVVSAAGDADLLYLATHGVADSTAPLQGSFVALHNGPWRATDVLGTPLRAQLVVLSACQTGLGQDVSGGTIGLARAFSLAGVPRVVMSLWSVDDAGTQQLMEDLVRHLDHAPPAVALQRAANDLRQAGAPASVWAAFSMLGSPR